MKWIEKYNGFLRSLRFFYFLYNVKNFKSLRRNKELYKAFGLKRSIFSSIQYKNLEHLKINPFLTKDKIISGNIENHLSLNSFSPEEQIKISNWNSEGFIILENFFSEVEVEKINHEISQILNYGKAGFNYTGRKIMQSYQHSKAVKNAFTNQRLLSILSILLGKKVIPFHTINFLKGSEQNAHSDAFHMSTFPEGNLIAVWVALEDIGEDQGPLFYYPRTHLWPQIKNSTLSLNDNFWKLDANANKKFETQAKNKLENSGIQPRIFLPKKGDILIWNSNLIHGGAYMKNEELTRKSLVMHYFTEQALCFHEISQRPAIFDLCLLNELGLK